MGDGFQVARLIPVSGISSNAEAETRATSALLAVLTAVRAFSAPILVPLGASAARKAKVEAFIETKFKMGDGTQVRPDGLIQVTYGGKEWRALIEVKTGDGKLEAEQINNYLTVAREQGIDGVITISNAIAMSGEVHPCDGVKVRANSRVRLAHYSWSEVLAAAVRAKVHDGIPDPAHDWILGELIRYLEHPASGVAGLDDMGPSWTAGRDAARSGTLHKGSDEARSIAEHWEQILRLAAIRLGARTGVDVTVVAPKAQTDLKARITALTEALAEAGVLDGTVRVPGAAGNLVINADLRARQLTIAIEVAAPS